LFIWGESFINKLKNKSYTYSFEKLEVWNLSVSFVKEIYKVTENYPEKEKFGLISQLRRASVSVPSNLAEGSSRMTNKNKAHFTQIAFGSLMELLCQLIISKELGYLDEKKLSELREKIEEIANKLNALHKFQLSK